MKIHTNAVRAFIRHAERRGWCAAGLADTLHGPHVYRDHGLPIGPSWDDVNRLIQDAASDDPTDVRDRAILLLLAVDGFRAGGVAALRLDDVDWEHDRLTVRRSKPGRSQVYPLMPVVGQAIIRYLKEAQRKERSGLSVHDSNRSLKPNVQADAWLRRVAALPDPPVPAYTELNARVGWLPTPQLELSLTGQDRLHAQHPEFGTPIPQRIEFQRSIRVAVTMRLP